MCAHSECDTTIPGTVTLQRLRLKMMSEDEVFFDLDSELGTGTLVQIVVPIKYLKDSF